MKLQKRWTPPSYKPNACARASSNARLKATWSPKTRTTNRRNSCWRGSERLALTEVIPNPSSWPCPVVSPSNEVGRNNERQRQIPASVSVVEESACRQDHHHCDV